MNRTSNRRVRILTDINLLNPFSRAVEVQKVDVRTRGGRFRLLRLSAKADAIILRLPNKASALLAFLARLASRNARLVYYDVNIPIVSGPWDRIKRTVYLNLVRRADLILTLQADTAEYARLLRLPEERLKYVGFKSNSWEDAEAVARGRQTRDTGTFVLACGRSYRDFATFTEAMREAGVRAKILLPPGRFEEEGTIPPSGAIPENVEIVEHDGTRASWVHAILGARLVVVPLRGDLIQPAGISVYLEAMNLARPVIVSEGPSSRNMLHDGVAGVVPAGDSGALARETLRVWNDDELRLSRIENGLQYVEGLGGVERMSRDILRTTLDVVSEGSSLNREEDGGNRATQADQA